MYQPSKNQLQSAAIDLRYLAVGSLLLSVWLVAIDPIINRDAIIYLRTAETYLEHGFLASQEVFDRPLLPVSLALIHQVTGIPLLYAGHIFNALLYAVLCTAFVSTVSVLGGDRRVQLFAAAVVLFHPILNGYRSSIMRDPGFWVFSLLALRELLLYSRDPQLRSQLKWLLYVGLATLFRFEGLFFAALGPMALLLVMPAASRGTATLRLLAPPLIAIGGLLGLVAVTQFLLYPGSQLFPHVELYSYNLIHFQEVFDQLAANTGNALLKFSAMEDASYAVVGGLAAILLINLCRAVTWPYIAVLLVGTCRKHLESIKPGDRAIILWHLGICLLYLGVFTLSNQFMLERYSSGFVMFALLYAPFILASLWNTSRSPRLVRAVVLLLLVWTAGDSVHNSDYKKAYIAEATEWIKDNTPADATLLATELYVAWFSDRQVDWSLQNSRDIRLQEILDKPELLHGHQYLAVHVKRGEQDRLHNLSGHPQLKLLKVFSSDNRGSIGILENPTFARYEEAVAWIDRELGAGVSVLSNNKTLWRIAQRGRNWQKTPTRNLKKLLDSEQWREFGYLIVEVSRADIQQWFALERHPELRVLKVFGSARMDAVAVIKNTALPPRLAQRDTPSKLVTE